MARGVLEVGRSVVAGLATVGGAAVVDSIALVNIGIEFLVRLVMKAHDNASCTLLGRPGNSSYQRSMSSISVKFKTRPPRLAVDEVAVPKIVGTSTMWPVLIWEILAVGTPRNEAPTRKNAEVSPVPLSVEDGQILDDIFRDRFCL